MQEERKTYKHSLVMDKREKLSMTGVTDVISFDEEMVVAETEMGIIILKGINLHVNRINLEKGELDIDGEINSLVYEDSDSFGKGGSSFFNKIFR